MWGLTAASDSDSDDGESMKLSSDNLPTGVSASTTNETTVSVNDDDVPAVTVSFGSGSHGSADGTLLPSAMRNL